MMSSTTGAALHIDKRDVPTRPYATVAIRVVAEKVHLPYMEEQDRTANCSDYAVSKVSRWDSSTSTV
jgi:hypothetical protein